MLLIARVKPPITTSNKIYFFKKQNLQEIFLQYYKYKNVCSRSTTLQCVNHHGKINEYVLLSCWDQCLFTKRKDSFYGKYKRIILLSLSLDSQSGAATSSPVRRTPPPPPPRDGSVLSSARGDQQDEATRAAETAATTTANTTIGTASAIPSTASNHRQVIN